MRSTLGAKHKESLFGPVFDVSELILRHAKALLDLLRLLLVQIEPDQDLTIPGWHRQQQPPGDFHLLLTDRQGFWVLRGSSERNPRLCTPFPAS